MQDQTGNALYSHGLYQSHNAVLSPAWVQRVGFDFFSCKFWFCWFFVFRFLFGVFSKKKKVFTSQKTPRSSCDVELQLKIKKSYGRFATSGSCVKSSWSQWNKGKDKAIFFGNYMATRDTATKSKAFSKAAQYKPSQGTFQGEGAKSTAQALQSCGSR